MANHIYEIKTKTMCPRCNGIIVSISIFHFGATYKIECALCGWGNKTCSDQDIYGDNEKQALARYKGAAMDASKAKAQA